MPVLAMGTMSLRDLEGHRADFREVLAKRQPYSILVTDQTGRCLEVDLFPDGVDWLLKVSSAGVVIFDCGGRGVAGVDDDMLCEVIVKSFQRLARDGAPAPS